MILVRRAWRSSSARSAEVCWRGAILVIRILELGLTPTCLRVLEPMSFRIFPAQIALKESTGTPEEEEREERRSATVHRSRKASICPDQHPATRSGTEDDEEVEEEGRSDISISDTHRERERERDDISLFPRTKPEEERNKERGKEDDTH